jgi:hypothetical protein
MRIRLTLAAVALLGAGALCGCTGSGARASNDPETQQIRRNPTPELTTLYQSDDDIQNNENKRMLNQDLGRVFFFDRPSRLAREPVPW